MLEFDNFRGYDKHDFHGWDLFHHVGTIVLIAVISIVLLGAVGVRIYLWKREKAPFEMLKEAAGACGYEMHPPNLATKDEDGSEGGGRGVTATPPAPPRSGGRDSLMTEDKKGLLKHQEGDFTDTY